MTDPIPGTRRLRDGSIYTYNEDLRLDYLATQAVENAPVDLTALTDDELTGLFYQSIRYDFARRGWPASELRTRIDAARGERVARGLVERAASMAEGAK